MSIYPRPKIDSQAFQFHTQGKSLEELAQNLKDLYQDTTSAEIPFLRRMDDLVIA
ncbi:MAG: hypothetical protein MUO64_13265 [Anaerolineales bacterium]|nr:hypothetical protein [Anaerolineales bacterium]